MEKFYKIISRKDYSLIIIPKDENVFEYIEKNYPYKYKKENIYIFKNKKNTLCYIFKNIEKEKNKIISSKYILNRYKNYKGIVYVIHNNVIEQIELSKGVLINSEIVNEITTEKKVIRLGLEEKASKLDVLNLLEKKDLIKRIVYFAVLSILLIILFMILVNKVEKIIEVNKSKQAEIDIQKKQILEKEQQLNDELNLLIKEYERKVKNSNKKNYPIINIIYSCLNKNTIINSLSIQKNNFSIEIKTDNSLEVLSKFESNYKIETIVMNRIANESGKEYVSFTGAIKNDFVYADKNLSNIEKINHYKKLLEDVCYEENFSEYVAEIKNIIMQNNCQQEYMQVKLNNDLIDLECNVKGTGKNILSFIKAIDDSPNNIEIKNLRIRNIINSSVCNLMVIFETKINKKNVLEDEIKDYDYVEKLPQEIGKVFGNDNERIINTKSRIAKKNIVLENKTEKIIQSRKKIKLNYIGKGSNSNFSNILFFKNPISGQIYKLPVVNDFIDQNCCIDVVNKYIVLIDGEEYEVDK